MPNPLLNVYNRNPNQPTLNVVSGGSTPSLNVINSPYGGGGNYNPQTNTQTLPYGGGTYNPAGKSTIFPAAPTVPTAPAAPVNDLYAKYRDPKTGEVLSPQEYAISLGNKVPKGTGQIPSYAGEALARPDQTTDELIRKATDLNIARTDIATGARDPYKVGSESGVAYSPKELKAIENAYAGIYDPALNDVFSRLRDKQAADDKLVTREERIFATNEAIRLWQATTGTKSKSESDIFTQSQLNNGASNSGLGVDAFSSLDNDIKNFYINPPMGLNDMEKRVPMYSIFEEDLIAIANGDLEANTLMDDINSSTLPTPVKHYFIEQIPDVTVEEKEGWFKKIWGAIRRK